MWIKCKEKGTKEWTYLDFPETLYKALDLNKVILEDLCQILDCGECDVRWKEVPESKVPKEAFVKIATKRLSTAEMFIQQAAFLIDSSNRMLEKAYK